MRLSNVLSTLAFMTITMTSVSSNAALSVGDGNLNRAGNEQVVEAKADGSDQSQFYTISPGSPIELRAEQVIFEQEEFRGKYKKSITLEKDDKISVLPATEESRKLGLVRIGLGVEDLTQEPSIVLVPESLISQTRLIPISDEQIDEEVLAAANKPDDDDMPIEQLMRGQESAMNEAGDESYDEARYGRWSFRHKRHGHRRSGMTYCLRNVRQMMCARGICCSNSFGGVAAYAMPNILRQCKHRMSSASIGHANSLKTGSVCCVRGGYHTCGGRPCGDCVMKIGPSAWTNRYGVRANPLHGRYNGGSCAALR